MTGAKLAVGLIGEFTDLTLHCGRRTWMMHVELPFDAWDPVAKGIGLPLAAADCTDPDPTVRTVAILSCRSPVHPEHEGDVLADAALGLLAKLLEEKRFRPVSAETIDRFTEVMNAVGAELYFPRRLHRPQPQSQPEDR